MITIIALSILSPLALTLSLIAKDRRKREKVGAYVNHPKGGQGMYEVDTRLLPRRD